MMNSLLSASLLLAPPLLANAQFGGGGGNPYSSGNNPFSNGNGDGNGDGPPDGFGSGFGPPKDINKIIAAHAVMAALAVGLFFPAGSILIRLASFRGLWLVHGIFQICVYLLYICAFGIGIWMATHLRMLSNSHPIIGMIVLVLLFFQPFLGLVHHFAFKKHSRRVVWSYAHIWIGRIAITLGIINGGLGLRLSRTIGVFPAPQSAIIGYSVVAAIIWLIWVACAIYGERKRRNARYASVNQGPPPYKQERPGGRGGVQYA